MIQYFITDNGDQPVTVVVRIQDRTWAERIVAGSASWELYPALARLAVDSLNMEWDEVFADRARAALVELCVDPAVLDAPFTHERPGPTS